MATPVTQAIDLDRLRSDLRRYTEIAEVPFDAPAVDRVIGPLAELFTGECWVGIRTTTKPVSSRDVNLRLNTAGSPVPLLRETGLLTYDGHPIESLASQIEGRFQVGMWGIDTSVKGMADKIWMGFAGGAPLEDFLTLADLPPAVHAARAHFDRAGMDRVGMIGMDFTSHSINLYGPRISPGTLTPGQIKAMLTDLGFPLPAEEEIQRNTQAFNLYQTFNWEDPGILRLCFPHMYPAAEFPVHYHPLLKAFVEQAPLLDSDTREFGLYNTYGPRGGYYKIQSDYTGNHRVIYPHHYKPGAAPQA